MDQHNSLDQSGADLPNRFVEPGTDLSSFANRTSHVGPDPSSLDPLVSDDQTDGVERADREPDHPQCAHQSLSVEPAVRAYPEVRMLWRRRQTWKRAAVSLYLTCTATCRSFAGGDTREENARLAGAMLKRIEKHEYLPEEEPAALACLPLLAARDMIQKQHLDPIEETLESMSPELPGHEFMKSARGFGALYHVGLVGECGDLWRYKSVAAVWKRMGLGMIEWDGQQVRQQRTKNKEQAIAMGYVPNRRAMAYVIATNLMRSQRPDDPYRRVYDEAKAKFLERGVKKMHAHKHGLRVMAKTLIRDLVRAGRANHAEDENQ